MAYRALPLSRRVMAAAETLYPGYFALVMATGALSVALFLLQHRAIAIGLLAMNLVAYGVLWGLLLLRLVYFRRLLLADVVDYARAPGFFTLVAGTCLIGTNIAVTIDLTEVSAVFWGIGILLWVVVMYGFFAIVATRAEKPALENGINGAWLLAAVATQSVGVLGGTLAPGFAAPATPLFFCLIMYLIGGMLYLAITTLIFYRLIFVRLTSAAFTPPYWINMGAAAITTLAGATLISRAALLPLLGDILPFLKGFTLFFWAAGTWWIPWLLILEIWRHGIDRHPFRYDPQYWSMVFPLAMYTICTVRLAEALRLDLLMPIPQVFVWLAAFVWLVVFWGMARRIVMAWRGRVPAAQSV
jgi:tellurite resistance protein TehA-like permease